MTIDPRVLAGMAAYLSAGLLLLLYLYRRRAYILLWCFGWTLIGTSMFVAARGMDATRIAALDLGVSQFLGFLSGIAFVVAARSYQATPRLSRAHLALIVISLLWFTLTPLLLRTPVTLAIGYALIGVAIVSGGVAHLRLLHRGWLPAAAAAGITLALIGIGYLYVAFRLDESPVDPAGVLLAMAVAFLLATLCMQVMIFEDMTGELGLATRQLEAAQSELKELAVTDPLTRCRNRRFFDEVIGRELNRHKRYDVPLSLLFADINRFKAINDELGHETGDRVLQEVAAFLKRNVREADYVFRWGGDEFLILLSCRIGEARRRARALQEAFASAPGIKWLPPGVGLSVGCVEVPPDATDIMEYVNMADELMYVDKRASR